MKRKLRGVYKRCSRRLADDHSDTTYSHDRRLIDPERLNWLKMVRQRLHILLASFQIARLSMKVVLRFLGNRHLQVRRLFKYIETILHRASRFESNRDEAKEYEKLLFAILSSMKNNSIGVDRAFRKNMHWFDE